MLDKSNGRARCGLQRNCHQPCCLGHKSDLHIILGRPFLQFCSQSTQIAWQQGDLENGSALAVVEFLLSLPNRLGGFAQFNLPEDTVKSLRMTIEALWQRRDADIDREFLSLRAELY